MVGEEGPDGGVYGEECDGGGGEFGEVGGEFGGEG